MAMEAGTEPPKKHEQATCDMSREPSTTMSTKGTSTMQGKDEPRLSRHHKRNLSFQGGSSPTSGASLETTTTAAAGSRRTIERTPSQFNAAFFDRQSIRSSRSCSNVSQRDIVVHDCNTAIALYNPYMQQPQHVHPLALATVGGEYMTALQPPHFPPPPPSLYWYQQYAAPPPPPFYFASQQMPPDFKTFKQAMKLEKKKMEAEFKHPPGACAKFCCSSFAQILWALITLACFGLLTALIFALFLV